MKDSDLTKSIIEQPLALFGGPMAVPDFKTHQDLFHWPIVTKDDEDAVLEVLRSGDMSGLAITKQFETEYAEWVGTKYALAHCNGTMALLAAMYGAGLGRGDEMICPSITYWASALQAYALRASVVFADVDSKTLCIDPYDIERHIGPRTKAIMVVHYCGHPCDMDPILEIAHKHNLKVIEDVSHAHGTLYKGRMVGTLGDVAGMSMMAAKSFAIGEAGMLVTDDREIYERVIAFCHYERAKSELTIPSLKNVAAADGFITALPLGGYKGRVNQTCSAMGRVQLKHYPERIKEIQKAMNYFWDLLENVPGLCPHRPDTNSGSTMGGWYNPIGHYIPEELGGLKVEKFIEAVNAEGGRIGRGTNFPLHLHPVVNMADVYGDGKPTCIAFSKRDLRQHQGSLPVAEKLAGRAFGIPWFKHYEPKIIEQYAAAYRKVAMNADKLLS